MYFPGLWLKRAGEAIGIDFNIGTMSQIGSRFQTATLQQNQAFSSNMYINTRTDIASRTAIIHGVNQRKKKQIQLGQLRNTVGRYNS